MKTRLLFCFIIGNMYSRYRIPEPAYNATIDTFNEDVLFGP